MRFRDALVYDNAPRARSPNIDALPDLAAIAPTKGSELRILQIALSLLGEPITSSLRDLLDALKETNLTYVLRRRPHRAGGQNATPRR
jgi:hypothetical protein